MKKGQCTSVSVTRAGGQGSRLPPEFPDREAGLRLPLAASPWSGAGKSKTLTAKSTATAVAQRGRGFFREAPAPWEETKESKEIRQTGATPQPDFPN